MQHVARFPEQIRNCRKQAITLIDLAPLGVLSVIAMLRHLSRTAFRLNPVERGLCKSCSVQLLFWSCEGNWEALAACLADTYFAAIRRRRSGRQQGLRVIDGNLGISVIEGT
jgi:hypothetical protein